MPTDRAAASLDGDAKDTSEGLTGRPDEGPGGIVAFARAVDGVPLPIAAAFPIDAWLGSRTISDVSGVV